MNLLNSKKCLSLDVHCNKLVHVGLHVREETENLTAVLLAIVCMHNL